MITYNDLKQSSVRFETEGHKYFMPDGSQVKISLTRLLSKYGIAPDFSGIDPEVLKEAAKRGTEVHTQIERYDNEGIVPTHEWAIPYTSLQLPVIASEFLVNYKDVVATKIDKVIATENGVIIADIKTTSKIELESVTWQCSLGAYMFEKQTGIKVTGIQCIHLRDGKAVVKDLVKIDDKQLEELLQAEEKDEAYFVTPVCMDIIPQEDGNEVVEFLKLEKRYKELKENLQAKLLTFMEENHLKELRSLDGELKVVYKAPTTRRSLDQKSALKDIPQLENYFKESKVKSSVTFYNK